MNLNSTLLMILKEVRTAFEVSQSAGEFILENNEINLKGDLKKGIWIGITGSEFNDGLWRIKSVNEHLDVPPFEPIDPEYPEQPEMGPPENDVDYGLEPLEGYGNGQDEAQPEEDDYTNEEPPENGINGSEYPTKTTYTLGIAKNAREFEEDGYLEDETFTGTIFRLRLPPDMIKLAIDVKAWLDNPVNTNGMQSEAMLGRYNYTKQSGEGGKPITWQDVFKPRLVPYRMNMVYVDGGFLEALSHRNMT